MVRLAENQTRSVSEAATANHARENGSVHAMFVRRSAGTGCTPCHSARRRPASMPRPEKRAGFVDAESSSLDGQLGRLSSAIAGDGRGDALTLSAMVTSRESQIGRLDRTAKARPTECAVPRALSRVKSGAQATTKTTLELGPQEPESKRMRGLLASCATARDLRSSPPRPPTRQRLSRSQRHRQAPFAAPAGPQQARLCVW